jgi:hypothetical protein
MSADQLRQLHEQSGFQTIECGYEGMGLSLACDRPNWWRKALQTSSYRTVQALRKGYELLRLQPPRSSFTGLFMVYRGKV